MCIRDRNGIKRSPNESSQAETSQNTLDICRNLNMMLNRQIIDMKKQNEELNNSKLQLERHLGQIYNHIGGLYLELVSSKKIISDLKAKLVQLEQRTKGNPETSHRFHKETVGSESSARPLHQQEDKKGFNPLLTKRRREAIDINDEQSQESITQEPELYSQIPKLGSLPLDWTSLID
eukprot:TRINITY_DN14813_c0_g1_i1.p1 TRINITY_DN14813_c0_g1~~TRINITY_DN14813_c0_g1_i1.p1  ORF type:complete len:195 (-),score=39.50 TRINITY_DN14813_c0_g1_i1:9-542(-)